MNEAQLHQRAAPVLMAILSISAGSTPDGGREMGRYMSPGWGRHKTSLPSPGRSFTRTKTKDAKDTWDITVSSHHFIFHCQSVSSAPLLM